MLGMMFPFSSLYIFFEINQKRIGLATRPVPDEMLCATDLVASAVAGDDAGDGIHGDEADERHEDADDGIHHDLLRVPRLRVVPVRGDVEESGIDEHDDGEPPDDVEAEPDDPIDERTE